ncbi:hypothetical protein [Bythopirellula goksoeyrii]|uniref:Uncharacterized protein n=1 Tax=Bythopirellula goksoeyrii TaxID=1400387 RepID=A0A5B9QDY2_9BACT|nr:hypothetical protein [Bythopirellula goksoeyrii]QEG35840.1 hypothetical protein Pr1d_31460 [Bythopirellula goksoeyrii]
MISVFDTNLNGVPEIPLPTHTDVKEQASSHRNPHASEATSDIPSQETVTSQGYTVTYGTGPVRRVAIKEASDKVLSKPPRVEKTPLDQMKFASSTPGGQETAKSIGASLHESNPEWNYFLQVAECVRLEVAPWLAAAQKAVEDANSKIKVTPHQKTIRKGAWKSLLDFGNFPDVVGIIFYSLVILVGGVAETTCGMVYTYVAWGDFVRIDFSIFTEFMIAFALTFGFVMGPFVLLKFIPFSQDAVGASRFFKRFRVGAVLLIMAGPVTFAWVLGTSKDFPPSMGSAAPPWNPGMIGYVAVAMFTLAFTTTAAAAFLKSCVNGLYTFDTLEIPEGQHVSTELGFANEALASCVSIKARAERAIKAYQAAQQNLELTCVNVSAAYQADLNARQQQAFLLEA